MVVDGDGAAGESESNACGEDRRVAGDDEPPENCQKLTATSRKPPETLPLPDRMLAVLRQNPAASRRTLATTLDTTESTIRYRLDKLRLEGRIKRIGPDRGGRWEVLPVPHAEEDPNQ